MNDAKRKKQTSNEARIQKRLSKQELAFIKACESLKKELIISQSHT